MFSLQVFSHRVVPLRFILLIPVYFYRVYNILKIMKFIVSSSYLHKELSIASSVISSRVALPILENFLFTLDKNQLHVSTSDLENSLKVVCNVTSEDKGSVCIPSKILLDYLRNIYEQPLAFEVKDGVDITITSDKGRYKLKGEDPTSFPKEPQHDNTNFLLISSVSLQHAIEKTIFAVSQDEVRQALNGIFFEKKDNVLRLVSSDAHRLVYQDIHLDTQDGNDQKVIVPKKASSIIKSFLSDAKEDTCQVAFSTNHLFLKLGNIQLVSRLVDVQYPDYRTVIPQNPPYTLKVDKDELFGVISRLTVFSNKANNLVIFSIKNNQVKITAQDSDFAREGEEQIPAIYQGEDIKIGFNGRFLHELLRSITSSEILIKFSSPQKAVLLFSANEDGEPIKDHLLLIMPLIV